MPRWRLMSAVALAVAVLVPAGPALAADPVGSVGVRLVDVPAGAVDDPRARLYIVDHVSPGTRIQRRVEVTSTVEVVTPVELYAAGASVANGSFTVDDDRTANELSTWMSVDPADVDLLAGGAAMATVTIDVPPDAAPGERYAVVWVEARGSSDDQSGVLQVSRVGIRVYLSVGPGGPPAADFEIDSLTAERTVDGQPIVVASVHNTGGRALDLSGTLTLLDGPGALSAGPFPAQLGVTLGIGETEPVQIALDPRLPAGPWDARLTLASGLVERTVRAELTFPETGVAPSVLAQSTDPAWKKPALLAIVAVLVACLTLLAVVVVRRRRNRHHETGPRMELRERHG